MARNEMKLTQTVAVLTVLLLLDSRVAYSQGSCDEWEIRLANSNSPLEGRVEVCRNGVWRTVCNQDSYGRSWYREAKVVCRQVGRQLGVEIFTGISRINKFNDNPTNLSILSSTVTCDGTEESLMDCSSQTLTSPCDHYMDTGVTCIPTNSSLLPTCRSVLQDFTGSYLPFACPQPFIGRSQCLVNTRVTNFDTSSRNDFLCNGDDDCGDCSDECHCGQYSPTGNCRGGRIVTICNCTEDEFLCRNGYCVIEQKVCDGYNDCADNSDETAQRCIDLSLSKIRNTSDIVKDRLQSQGETIGIVVAVLLGITLIAAVVLVLCMLVPQCPLREEYSAKPDAGVGRSGAQEVPSERPGDREDDEVERSSAPLLTNN